MPARIDVVNHLTLDGVMQGPGGPDEDTRDGFAHGGWAIPGNDQAMLDAVGERMGKPDGGPFKEALNALPRYVASNSADTTLDWPNSTLLHGDVPAAVERLRQERDGDLTIMGSGELIRSLLPHRLIDELLLMIHVDRRRNPALGSPAGGR